MRKFLPFFKKRPTITEQLTNSSTIEDELKTLTTELIDEAKNEISTIYQERIASYSVDKNPLSVEVAEEMLLDMAERAVIIRQQLNVNIQRSISDGSLYYRYFNKVALVNEMTNETYTKLKRMQRIQERFEYKKKLYNNVTGRMYLEHAIKAQLETTPEKPEEDIGVAIDKAGGEIDDESI